MAIVTSTQQREMRERMEQSRGLGDTIAKATKAVGIKPCGGCKKRQDWLNEKFPYSPRKKK